METTVHIGPFLLWYSTFQKEMPLLSQALQSQPDRLLGVRRCIRRFPDWVDNEIYAYNNKHSLRSNTKGYGGKTEYTDSQNSDTNTPNGSELYHLQFSLQADSPETFGYNPRMYRSVSNSEGNQTKPLGSFDKSHTETFHSLHAKHAELWRFQLIQTPIHLYNWWRIIYLPPRIKCKSILEGLSTAPPPPEELSTATKLHFSY
jgi:hypothetical protein